jgi:hypothetical protein
MAGIGVRIEGLEETNRLLRALGNDPKEIREAGKEAAKIVATDAHADPLIPIRTGLLKSSIRAGGTAKGGYVQAGRGGKTPYAVVIYWGWAKRNIKPNRFILRALNKDRDKVRKTYEDAIRKIIRKYE